MFVTSSKLAAFTLAAVLLPSMAAAKSIDIEDLPSGCEKFTVGKCDPAKDEEIAVYHLPNNEGMNMNSICQEVCQIQEGCNFFVYNKAAENCTLYHYRYLDSCAQVGGTAEPSIDDCAAGIDSTCDTFVQEDCHFTGADVFHETSVTDAHSCQRLLKTIGFAYNAKYFIYDSAEHICTFYDSEDFDCDSLSGPELPDLDTCNSSPSSTTESSTGEYEFLFMN